ncbi:MAG: hypothetical protein KBD16_02880 [Candidatus Pacebacteria bacterium]|nr:hypothetical protein [Candidatus Paceibacterota bacterium]
MAEKPGGKGGGKPAAPKTVTDADAATKLIMILLALAVIASILVALGNLGGSGNTSVVGFLKNIFSRSGLLTALYEWLRGPFLWLSMLVSVIFGAGAIYSFLQLKKIREKQKAAITMLEAKLKDSIGVHKNERWERIETLASSENPGDWRIAIIEADIALDELVRSMGYHGDSLGDMLKGVEKSDFQTLDLAWEAHKVRNRIAHSGSDYILTNREAKRVIDLFRQVFKEFDVV